MRIIALLAVLLLAGCAGPSTPETVDGTPSAPPVLISQPLLENKTLPVVPLVSNLTTFHFASNETSDAVVYRFRLDLGADNRCSVGAGRAGTSVQGPSRLVLVEEGDRIGWSFSDSGGAHAQAGPFDSRDITSSAGHSAGTSVRTGTYSGVTTVTFAGRSLATWDNSLISSTLGFSVKCDAPFAILDAHRGMELALWSSRNVGGTASAADSRAGSAMIQAAGDLDVTSPYGRLMMIAHQTGSGRITAYGGGGTVEQTFVTQNTIDLEGGPGDYGFTASRGAAGTDIFLIAAYGLSEPFDLTPYMQSKSAMSRF